MCTLPVRQFGISFIVICIGADVVTRRDGRPDFVIQTVIFTSCRLRTKKRLLVQTRRLRHFRILEILFIPGRILEEVMGRLVMMHQKKRFAFIPLLQPLECQIRNHIRRMAFMLFQVIRPGALIFIPECGIKILALPRQYLVIIEVGFCVQMPLADHGCLVSKLLHLDGKILIFHGKRNIKNHHTIGLRILSCQNAGPAGTADGIGDETIFEQQTISSQFVQCGSGIEPGKPASISANARSRMVIGHDKEYIWFLAGRFHCSIALVDQESDRPQSG